MLSPVCSAINTALLLRARRAPQRAHKRDVGIGRMNQDPSNASRVIEAHVRPVFAGVRRKINAVAHHVAVANRPGLPCAHPDHAGVERRNRDGTDGRYRMLVEDRIPAIAPIRRFPDAAGSGARVIRARVTRDAGDRSNTVPSARPDKSKPERLFVAHARWALRVGKGRATC